MNTDSIAVIGSGSIGTGWAIVFASAGRMVRLHDIAAAHLEEAKRVVAGRLDELAGFGLLNEPPAVIAGRVSFTTDLATAVVGTAHVQECIPENRDAKLEVLARLAKLASDDCVIASSSSFIPMSQIAAILPGRERCLVIHPGNPPFLLRIAEICPAPFTDPAAIDKSEALMRSCGLSPIMLRIEKDGFIFNRLQGALLREAYALIAEGATNAADIDRLVRDGMVERQADPRDRRATRVHLTAQGRETAARGAAVVAGIEARAFADLEEDDARALGTLLDRVIERMAPGDRA